ncbi:transglycosylase domain-containing protein [Staphylococcus epidermidis]|uniref:transglycosylase domain-containing protein n=1 Tax=Staphylococcus epidermidis TaxID=1282 RepID=UPI00209217D6|nr:transglycosylase domain-containing protein [Staphylococcus epidermidis]MCO6289785.1 penicillin-binding protein [Staphylococcus epidermidis]
MHFNKYQILTTDKYTKFEHLYKKVKHICVTIFLVFFLIGFIILLSLVFYFQQLTKDASSISDKDLKAKILHIPGDELINHNNQILEEYDYSQNTLIVGPNHVNSNIIHALTASEDTLFYKHNGIMPKALLRAMLQDITNSNQSSGGSTITQQLVKNQVLSNKKTYSRKANEIILATRVETLLSKDEIIYTYLNIVPFGHDYNGANITGISSASYSLFGIPAKDLNVAQSAYLIGLLQSPYGYTPYEEHGKIKPHHLLKLSMKRQQYVLKRMRVEGKISKQQYKNAEKYNIKQHLLKQSKDE